jgi:hypothetical protein
MKMKKAILCVIFICLIISGVSSQYSPGGINYQAIARDNAGNELKNRNIDVRISIISGNAEGTVEYAESRSVTTDGFGLFNYVIGTGSRYAGVKNTLAEVNWGSAPHFLKVEVDFVGNGDYLDMNPFPLQAVPYALHAGTASNFMGSLEKQKLIYDFNSKEITLTEEGGVVNLREFLQNLSYNAGSLSISGGNEVFIDINDGDSDPNNEIQDLILTQENILKISRNPQATEIDLGPFLSNTDNQILEIINDSLAISGGNKIKIDLSSTNEIQDLSISQSNVLKITGNPSATEIDLKPFLDNTDSQILQILNDSLSITGGNKVFVDLSTTNEIQDLILNSDTLSITRNPNATRINLKPYLDNTDNQILFKTNDSLAISGGNKIKVDFSDTNEIQDLQLNSHILTITGKSSPNSINLSPYLDNSDEQNLDLNGFDLSISGGNSVNIRPEVIAYRAIRNGGNPLSPGDSVELKFPENPPLSLNTNNVFTPITGRFTVPANGAGLYRFDLIYNYEGNGHSIRFSVNGVTREVIFDWIEATKSGLTSYNIIIYLNAGDYVSLFLKNTRSTTLNCQPAIFSGYRIH